MKKLINQLKTLKQNYGVVGIKQSFQDQGVDLKDVITMRRITQLCEIPMYVKIGGCQAKTDIKNCYKLGIQNVIAPMIQSKFALSKYLQTMKNYQQMNTYFVCQTSTAVSNIGKILLTYASKLTGVIVGRSDLTKSFDRQKKQTQSKFIQNKVIDVLSQCKKYNLLTTMGGNISVSSVQNINQLHRQGLLDNIQTRNVVLSLNNIHNLNSSLKMVLSFQQQWIKYKLRILQQKSWDYKCRLDILGKRQHE